jgi:hypothetical protein
MPSAALLFMDVVGYSAEATDTQYDTILELNREVHYVLYRDFDPLAPRVIAVPTGDGMLLALLDAEDSPRPNLAEKCFELLASLQAWTGKTRSAALRYGLHYGAITFVRDINGRKNICGDAVNISARLMSLGKSNHIIASDGFLHHFIPQCANNVGHWVDAHGFRVSAVDEIDIKVKHGRRILGYNLLLERGEMEIGNREPLDIKYYAEVRFPAVSKKESRESTLSRILPEAEKITFVGFSYANLPGILDSVGDACKEVVICIPNDDASEEGEAFFAKQVQRPNRAKLFKSISEWHSSHSKIKVKVLEYSKLPPFGAMLAERKKGNRGFLHLSMYLQDIAPENTPFMELRWTNTAKAPDLYRFYVDYIKKMIASWPEVSL